MSRYKKKPNNKGQSVRKQTVRAAKSPPQLSPPQIAVTAGLLTGFFDVETVLYNRNNEIKIILTSNPLTNQPILGNFTILEEEEEPAVEFLASEAES